MDTREDVCSHKKTKIVEVKSSVLKWKKSFCVCVRDRASDRRTEKDSEKCRDTCLETERDIPEGRWRDIPKDI